MGIRGSRGSRRYTPGPNGIMSLESCFSRIRRRQRQAYSSPPHFSHTPSDSGYGSGPTTPKTPEPPQGDSARSSERLCMLGDGNLPDSDGPFNSGDDDENVFDQEFALPIRVAPRTSPANRRPKPATLPIRSTRPQPSLLLPFLTGSGSKIPRRSSNIGLTRSATGSVRQLDRFIPPRSNSTDTAEKFRTSKAHHELTPTEKILRHGGANEDAFCYRRRVSMPMAADYRPQIPLDNAGIRNRG